MGEIIVPCDCYAVRLLVSLCSAPYSMKRVMLNKCIRSLVTLHLSKDVIRNFIQVVLQN